jgi:hypothetical protein
MSDNLWMVNATVRDGYKKEFGSTVGGFTNLPLSLVDHLLAILVNQGSEPTVPYQALLGVTLRRLRSHKPPGLAQGDLCFCLGSRRDVENRALWTCPLGMGGNCGCNHLRR